MIGVSWNPPGLDVGLAFTISLSGELQRQAISRLLTLARVICASGEYFVLAPSPA